MVTRRWRLEATDPVIQQHVVKGRTVLPFAAWLNRCFDAVTAAQSTVPQELRRVVVARPLIFTAGSTVTAQFLGRSESGRFEVRADTGSTEQPPQGIPFVEGTWQDAADDDWLPARLCSGAVMDHATFYRVASSVGYAYGPQLRRIARLQADESAWTADLSPAIEHRDAAAIRETTWDALLQSGAVLAAARTDACWVPVAIDRARLLAASDGGSIGQLCGEWIADSTHSSERVANIWGFGTAGTAPRLELRGVHYRVLDALPADRPHATGSVASLRLSDVRSDTILEMLGQAAPELRQPLLVRFIEDQLLEILQWDHSRRAELAAGFAAIGVDSLSSLDLQYRLQTALKFALPLGEGFDQPSATDLAAALLHRHVTFEDN